MKRFLSLLAVVLGLQLAHAQQSTLGGGGGGVSSTSGGAMGAGQGGKLWIWEDFQTGSSLDSLGMMNRKIQNLPDNAPLTIFKWRSVDGGTGGSNAVTVSPGIMFMDSNRVTGISAGSGYGWHMYVSNGVPGHGFSRIGGSISFVNTPNVNGFITGVVPILGPAGLMAGGGPNGNFLHIQVVYDSISIGIGTTGENIMRQIYPTQFAQSNIYNIDFQIVSNVLFAQIGPYFYTATHPILPSIAGPQNGVNASCELFGSPSNTVQMRWHSFYAGEAEPWAIAAAAAMNVNTNAGFSGANTNYVLRDDALEQYINGATNVNIAAVMLTETNLVQNTATKYWTLTITNGSGTDRLFSVQAVSNRWRFNGTYGTNGALTLTNNTGLVLSIKQNGTNLLANYKYFAWPF